MSDPPSKHARTLRILVIVAFNWLCACRPPDVSGPTSVALPLPSLTRPVAPTLPPAWTPTTSPTPRPGPTLIATMTPTHKSTATPIANVLDGELTQEQTFGDYRVTVWWGSPGCFSVEYRVVIERAGQVLWTECLLTTTLSPLSGTDLTGDGQPEVVLETYTSLQACCLIHDVLELKGDTASRILTLDYFGWVLGTFRDLNGDGRYEYLFYDQGLAFGCADAQPPNDFIEVHPTVIYQYNSGSGYVPAPREYPEFYQEEIAKLQRRTAAIFIDTPNPTCYTVSLINEVAGTLVVAGRLEEALSYLHEHVRVPALEEAYAHAHEFYRLSHQP